MVETEFYDAAVSGADPVTERPGFLAILQDGRTYSVYLRPNNETMEVEGCLLMFCRTQLWPRVTKTGEDVRATQ